MTTSDEKDLGASKPDPAPNRNRSSWFLAASVMPALVGVLGSPSTDPPPMMDAEKGSSTLGVFPLSDLSRVPSKNGLDSGWSLVAIMGGKGPWKVMMGVGSNGGPPGPSMGTMFWWKILFSTVLASLRLSEPTPRNRCNRPDSRCWGLACCWWGRKLCWEWTGTDDAAPTGMALNTNGCWPGWYSGLRDEGDGPTGCLCGCFLLWCGLCAIKLLTYTTLSWQLLSVKIQVLSLCQYHVLFDSNKWRCWVCVKR